MGIDDLVDRRTDRQSPGERFHEEWLEELPVGQWPSYIDDSAQLLADGILIGDTELTSADFAPETGEYYRDGLAESADIDPESTSLPLGSHSAKDIGQLAWVFNRLREEMRKSKYTDFQNPSRAIEASVNKSLVESIEAGQIAPDDMETIRLPETATVSTLVSEVFCRPRSEQYIDLLLNTVRESGSSSLLEHLDEPRMVTTLWEHQREALDSWFAHDCRGYVDMATATGKTVLGLAAIAHHFGALHPRDRDLTHDRHQPERDSQATVLVVAHRDLILDQWQREFDTHLNIPEQSATQSGEHTAHFEWGDVHFWTPKRLKGSGVPNADLVVLDETHHYLGSSGFGSILDEIDGHLLALSGSLDDANARTLERREIPEIFEYTLQEGQNAGIIPQCDWNVVFTPYEEQSQLVDITDQCRAGMKRYGDGIEPPEDSDQDEPLSFENLSEARSIAQSTIGKELKEVDPEFREFASAVMGRQLTQYNLSPTLSTVVSLLLDRIDQHKCVVLLETNEEIDWVVDELESQLGEGFEDVVTVLDSKSDLEAVETFDHERDHGAIIGLARTLGEGIDIETADVCINRGRGRLSRSLVQRMGRILRNPDGNKHAHFFHISAVPTEEDAILPDEDGVMLLETASQLLSWGKGFDARPVFEVDSRTRITERDIATIETAGATAIDNWQPDHYELPADADVREHLMDLCDRATATDGSTLLSIERPEREELDEPNEELRQEEEEDRKLSPETPLVAADGDEIPVHGWLYTLAIAASEDDPEGFIERSVRNYAREALNFSKDGLTPTIESAEQVGINPALEAVLAVHAGEDAKKAVVNVAIARAVGDDMPHVLEQSNLNVGRSEIEAKLEQLYEGIADE